MRWLSLLLLTACAADASPRPDPAILAPFAPGHMDANATLTLWAPALPDGRYLTSVTISYTFEYPDPGCTIGLLIPPTQAGATSSDASSSLTITGIVHAPVTVELRSTCAVWISGVQGLAVAE